MSHADYARRCSHTKGAGAVGGAITITGMASHEDHALAFEAIEKAATDSLDVDISSLFPA